MMLNRTAVLALLTAAVFIAAFYPALEKMTAIWLESDDYSHAFLTIPIILYMIWTKRDELAPTQTRSAALGIAVLAVSCLLYYFALLTDVNTLIFLLMYTAMLSIIVYTLGYASLRILFTPLLLALLLVPIPDQLYIKLTFPLQLKVSQISAFIIRLFDIPLLREGNVMHIPEKSFEVVEACSGLRSIITLLTLSIIIGYFLLKKPSSKIVLALVSVPTAIIVNIFRVSVMIVVYHYFQMDLTEGTMHTASGIGVFVLAFIIIMAVQRGLERWENR